MSATVLEIENPGSTPPRVNTLPSFTSRTPCIYHTRIVFTSFSVRIPALRSPSGPQSQFGDAVNTPAGTRLVQYCPTSDCVAYPLPQ